MLRVLPPMNQTCFATNQVVARCGNADFLLKKKKLRGSYVTCCKTSLPWAGKTRNMSIFCSKIYSLLSAKTFRNLHQADLLRKRFDWWVVKRATSPFISFCSSVAKQRARFCCLFSLNLYLRVCLGYFLCL